MAHLSLSLLGTFRVHLAGKSIVEFESDKARALLAYLAVEADHPHRRDQLAGLLWPDWPDVNARGNLRHALNNLRTVLRNQEAPSPFLLSDRQTIQFNPDSDYHLDVTEFSQHLMGLAEVEPGHASEQTIQRWQQAVQLYTGPFLSGFFLRDCSTFEEWVLLTRERLQLQMLAALHALALYFEQQGEYKEAQHFSRRQVELDALNEEAHYHLMRLLALTGQRSAALIQFETCRQLLVDELGVAPSAETITLHRQIQTGQLRPLTNLLAVTPAAQGVLRPAAPRHNLPAQTTPLIGRAAELAAVRTELANPEVRLLTLTGSAGTGKTRLALQVATDLLDHFADGVFFVSLAPVREPELVGSTIAEALGVREAGDKPMMDLLKEFVQDKHLLLVLDNFEHVTPAIAVVTDLLTSAPRLKIMVTSRALLRLYGEHNYAVPPLTVPNLQKMPPLERLLEYEACQLFFDRARAIKADFAMTHENAQAVAEICVKLDGLPLAIELAAARIGLLPSQQILTQLSSRLQFLTRGARNSPARHQTLRNTIDWSYNLLDPAEQNLFQWLAIFAGSWTVQAAEAVGNVSSPIDLLSGLESLVDNSLLKQFEWANGSRFVMLATIREYGLERLRTSGEAEFIQHAYVNYYLGLAEAMTQALREGNQETWLRQLETEHDNLRDVLSWVRDNGETETSLKLVGALWRFWEMRGHFTEGRQRLEEALTTGHNASLALQAEAHTGAGTMAWYQNDYKQAIIHHETALALYQELGDQPGVAFALNNLGVQALDQGDYEQAGQFFEQSLVFSRKLGHKVTMIYALHNLGDVARRQRNYERAAALYEETLALCWELEDTWAASIQLTWLGVVRQYLGDYEQATMRLKESLILSRRLDDKERIAECLEGYAGLAVAQAGPERAARLWGAVGALRAAIGVPMALDERDEYERNVAITHDALSEAAFAAAWAAGCSMTLEQVMEYALDESLAET